MIRRSSGYTDAVKRAGNGVVFVGLALVGIVLALVLAGAPIAKTRPSAEPGEGPVRLPARVTIAGIQVGGLSPSAAVGVLRLVYRSPLVLSIGGKKFSVSPSRLGARAYFSGAVRRARQAGAGSSVALTVTVRGDEARSYVAWLARGYDRKAVDARVALSAFSPHIYPESAGRALVRDKAVAAIVTALRTNERGPLAMPVTEIKPSVTADDFGPMIVIRRESKALYFYEGERLVRSFPVATGQAVYPTPIGDFHIIAMWRNPWWYPPHSQWARGLKPIPPGPGNPLGTRWMGISAPGVGIHGTPDPASVGYSASHGCIRMYIPSAEWLFSHVRIGAPVFIVPV
jgi:lipoprotein-anchoring transpeptidase ErfK/SrfK